VTHRVWNLTPRSRKPFAIPLDFEILTDHGPFYQTGLTDRLSFELIFNDYARFIRSTDAKAIYRINNIAEGYTVVVRGPCTAPGAMGPAFSGNCEFYNNTRITKVQVTVEGIPTSCMLRVCSHTSTGTRLLRDLPVTTHHQTCQHTSETGMFCGWISGAVMTKHHMGRVENASGDAFCHTCV